MATVTSFTAARLQALEDATIVGGHIDGSGHLILEANDASTVDAGGALVAVPNATTSLNGIVELATSAETSALTDAVRAITPAGLAALIGTLTSADTALDGRLDTLEAEPGERVQAITAPAESASYSSYPVGLSITTVSAGDSWSLNSSQGTILTVALTSNRTYQVFYSNAGGTQTPAMWFRTYHSSNGGGGWTSWRKLLIQEEVTAPTQLRFTSSSPTNAVPTGAKKARIRGWGGGAAGGGAAAGASGQSAHGGGGQAGGYSESFVDVSAFSGNIAVVIGAAGSVGAAGANDGGNGGQTTVNSTLLTAPGGLGGDGGGSSAGVFPNAGGGGGTAGTGDIATVGAPGVFGFGGPGLCTGGTGGSTSVGSGGLGPALASSGQSIAGTAGTGYGSGGGGGASSSASGGSGVTGGAGRPGLVIIDFFY